MQPRGGALQEAGTGMDCEGASAVREQWELGGV